MRSTRRPAGTTPTRSLKRVGLVAGGAVLGGAALAATGGIAAPAIGGALGSVMGLSGAAATTAGLAARRRLARGRRVWHGRRNGAHRRRVRRHWGSDRGGEDGTPNLGRKPVRVHRPRRKPIRSTGSKRQATEPRSPRLCRGCSHPSKARSSDGVLMHEGRTMGASSQPTCRPPVPVAGPSATEQTLRCDASARRLPLPSGLGRVGGSPTS